MKKVLLILVLPLLMLKFSFGGEVNFEKGYYYVVIKNGNFDKVNATSVRNPKS